MASVAMGGQKEPSSDTASHRMDLALWGCAALPSNYIRLGRLVHAMALRSGKSEGPAGSLRTVADIKA